jgi:hypothetical protein
MSWVRLLRCLLLVASVIVVGLFTLASLSCWTQSGFMQDGEKDWRNDSVGSGTFFFQMQIRMQSIKIDTFVLRRFVSPDDGKIAIATQSEARTMSQSFQKYWIPDRICICICHLCRTWYRHLYASNEFPHYITRSTFFI